MVASDWGRFEGLRKPEANIGGVADDWVQFLLGISTWESAVVAFGAVGGMFFGRFLFPSRLCPDHLSSSVAGVANIVSASGSS
jgi:hypothetical protein